MELKLWLLRQGQARGVFTRAESAEKMAYSVTDMRRAGAELPELLPSADNVVQACLDAIPVGRDQVAMLNDRRDLRGLDHTQMRWHAAAEWHGHAARVIYPFTELSSTLDGRWLEQTAAMNPPAAFLADPPQSPAVIAAYEADVTSDGYVNNLTRVWCWRPDVLASFQALRADLLAHSGLSPREVAVMVAATAAARSDAYCALAWGSRLAELSDEATAARVLQGVDSDLSEREAALAGWS